MKLRNKERPTRQSWKDSWKYLPRALPYVRPHWRLGAVSVVTMVLIALAALLGPWPLAIIVDSVLGDRPAPALLRMIVGEGKLPILVAVAVTGFILTLISNGLTVLSEYVNTRLQLRMVLDFRSELFQHSQRLSLAYHDRRRTGDYMNRINWQASSVGTVVMAIPPLAQSFLTLIGMLLIAFRIDALLALLSLTVVPLIYASIGYYAKRIQPRILRVKNMEGESLSIVHEAMSMMRVVVAFGRERHEYRRFRDQGERALDARVKLTVRQTLFSLAVDVITAAGTALVLGFGAYRAMEGQLSTGKLLVLMSYIASVYGPLQAISGAIGAFQDQHVGLQMSFELLDTDPDIKERPGAVVIDRTSGTVRFDSVHFSYQSGVETLRDISFEARAGQLIGIVGPTGAGKTTLVSLIPRYYEPTRGHIRLDGKDIRDLTVESLRRQFSIVHQEPLLFSETIAENILYGRLDASMAEVVEAAKAANAHDFIMRLPQQYGTRLGERGSRISGGERQRICIARAFLRDAPILILDEPTSSIDSRTEGGILDALDRLIAGRTTLLIAHRLSTIRHADMILVLNEGRIIQQGTHEELEKEEGLYRLLHQAQTKQRARSRFAVQHGADGIMTSHMTGPGSRDQATPPSKESPE